ncbi:LysE family translocator [Nocardiopsis sp. YSL2]|uniref:LysE family translocator n=1 Tax=Nocardiopsis sp. YSL2 TaxID=2939492 RepID=UPI0026F465F0|nr:LysE family translocator [Nocardiopsis sp. YSL2]
MSAEFVVTALVVVLTPGTGVLYTVAAGLARGVRGAAVAALGCTLGIVPHLVAAATGLAALLHTSAVAFQVLRYAGVAYLLFMAWSIWRDRGALEVSAQQAERGVWRVIGSGVLVNLLNPKLTIFFFAFLPQFVAVDAASALGAMLGLGGVFMAMTLVVFVGYGCCSALVRDRVVRSPRVVAWLRRGFAGAFAALGLRLALP